MNTSLRKLLLAAFLLALTMTSCGLPGGIENNGDPVATSVAATMEALGLWVEGSKPNEPLPIVAYADGGDLWVSYRDGEKRLIYSGDKVRGVRISPDGNQIVFSTTNQTGVVRSIWEINADGTNLRRLIDRAEMLTIYNDPSVSAVQMSCDFIPGKNMLACSTYPVRQASGYAPQGDLHNLDLDGGTLETIIPPTNRFISYDYSPDGGKIAFVEDGSVGLMGSNGGERQEDLITYAEVAFDFSYPIYPVLSWAEDSSRLRVVIPLNETSEGETRIAVWEISAVDGSGKELVTVPANYQFRKTVSPDLRHLLYLKQSDETTTELHIVDLDQREDTILYTGPQVWWGNREPWSPDSSAFLFIINGQYQLARLGSGYSVIPVAGKLLNVRWVDDTSYLVYTGEEPNFQLDYISIGSAPVTITTLAERFPSFDVVK